MSKVKDLLKSDDSVLIFDVDGVLALMEFGIYNHFLTDEEWHEKLKSESNFYTEDKVSKKMQKFLKNKNMKNIYVVTKIDDNIEEYYKKEYLKKYYDIDSDNVYCVRKDDEKIDKLLKIKERYPNLDDYKIVMIDDTADILTNVLNKTNFSTAHISSFLDI